MKELSYTDRNTIANLLRRRAIEIHDRIQETTSDAQKAALAEESVYYETLAIRIDDGDALVKEQKTPITPTPGRDTEYLHEAVPVGKDNDTTLTRRPVARSRPDKTTQEATG